MIAVSLPKNLEPIVDALKNAGGKPYLAGGAVRDMVMGYEPKDFDIEVYGINAEKIVKALNPLGKVGQVGAIFGVIILTSHDGLSYDISIPRRESKVGNGHKGFIAEPDPSMTPKEACARRDYTINSLLYDFDLGEIIDYYGGVSDIETKTLRHVSKAFSEDPLRVLRGMQFAARFGMTVAPETAELCRGLKSEYSYLSVERIWGEWLKWATKSTKPSLGFQFLRDTGWIDLYPEISAMIDVPQHPDWHPEGWLLKRLPFKSDTAGATVPVDPDLIFSSFDLAIRPSATEAAIKSLSGTPSTEAVVDPQSVSLFRTSRTGAYCFDLPSLFGPATIAQTESFMCSVVQSAHPADKIVRVMFKISNPGVLGIVNGSINDLKVFKDVILSIPILVMNMLIGRKAPSQVEFHNETMDIDPSFISWPSRATVSKAILMNRSQNAVDHDIILSVDVAISNLHRSPPLLSDDITKGENSKNELLLVKLGCVYTHVCIHVIDYMNELSKDMDWETRAMLMLAALCHDFGKPSTTKFMRDGRDTPGSEAWRSHDHANAGVDLSEKFLTSIGCLRSIIDKVKPLVKEHLVHSNPDITAKTVRRLALRLQPATIQELCWLIEADASGRPPKPVGLPAEAKKILDLSQELEIVSDTPKPILLGRMLIAEGLMKPGPQMGELLKEAFQAQLDEVFSDKEGALEWAKGKLA